MDQEGTVAPMTSQALGELACHLDVDSSDRRADDVVAVLKVCRYISEMGLRQSMSVCF